MINGGMGGLSFWGDGLYFVFIFLGNCQYNKLFIGIFL
jgi:hypothetical protein